MTHTIKRHKTKIDRRFSLDTNPIDIVFECGRDSWKLSRTALASRSEYFAIVCSVEQSNPYKRGKVVIPVEKQRHIACVFHFLQQNLYYGPLDNTKMSVIEPDHDPYLRAGQRKGGFDGCTLEIKSQDERVLKYFPAMKDGWYLYGDKAIRAYQIAAAHDSSKSALHNICRGLYWLKPELLRRSIQFELFEFLVELRFDQSLYSNNTVFHAQMFWEAQKYMLPDLEDAIAQAFRMGAKPYINTTSPPEGSFITAVRLIWEAPPHVPVHDNTKMLSVLVRVMAAHWGWMRHEAGVMSLLQHGDYSKLRDMVRFEAARNMRKWETESLPLQKMDA